MYSYVFVSGVYLRDIVDFTYLAKRKVKKHIISMVFIKEKNELYSFIILMIYLSNIRLIRSIEMFRA